MKIKIDTVNKEIIICDKVSLDELSLFLTGLKDGMDLSEFSIYCEPIKVKEYITVKETSNPLTNPYTNQFPNPFTVTC